MTRAAIALALLLGAGCSALVGGETPPTRRCVPAAEGDTDPCAFLGEGWRCVVTSGEGVGECASPRPSVPEICGNDIDDDQDGATDEGSVEVCDQTDNDCDTRIDEEIDLDEDGYAGCEGSMFAVDCDDTNPQIHPEVADVCDGIDNDCDPATLDGSSQCMAPQICMPPEGCVEVTCATSPGLCDPTLEFCDMGVEPAVCRNRDTSCLGTGGPCVGATPICDPDTGECAAPQPDGTPCLTDAQCVSTLCVPNGALRLTRDDVGGDGVCSRLCCTNADCASGQTCWDSGSGSRVCVPDAFIAADPPSTPSCSVESDCSGSDLCRGVVEDVHRVPQRVTTGCGNAVFSRLSCPGLTCSRYDGSCSLGGGCYWDECNGGAECSTGMCFGRRCREACGSDDDCVNLVGRPDGACVHVSTFLSNNLHTLQVCSYEGGAGVGATCGSHGECASHACVDDLGRDVVPAGEPSDRVCRRVCCSDSQCTQAEQCRPTFISGRYESLCLPRRTFGAGGGG